VHSVAKGSNEKRLSAAEGVRGECRRSLRRINLVGLNRLMTFVRGIVSVGRRFASQWNVRGAASVMECTPSGAPTTAPGASSGLAR